MSSSSRTIKQVHQNYSPFSWTNNFLLGSAVITLFWWILYSIIVDKRKGSKNIHMRSLKRSYLNMPVVSQR